ncbi:MAG: ABC-2 family transporter protein [Sumerlaeia bacterium]
MSPRLFLHVLSLEARKSMSYRVDFWLNTIVGFAISVGYVTFLWLSIYAQSGEEFVEGFTLPGLILYYVLIFLIARIVTGNSQSGIVSGEIYEGRYTKFLLYPTRYLPFKYAENLGSLVPSLIQAVVFGFVALTLIHAPGVNNMTAGTLAMAVVSVAMASVLLFLLFVPLQGVAFWADNVWSLYVMLRMVCAFLGGQMLPLSLFPDWAQTVLAWTPFPYLFYVPTQVALGNLGPLEWARGLVMAGVWCAVMAGVIRAVWMRGERRYTGVGI